MSAGPLTGFSPGGEPPWGNRVDSMTVIRDARGAGDLSVFIGVVDQSAAAREKARCQREEAAQCTVQSGPNGETVLLSTERDPLPPGNPRNWVVQVFRGHTEINVQVSNTHQSQGADGDAPAVARPEPPLSADQAVRLALSPELYLFP